MKLVAVALFLVTSQISFLKGQDTNCSNTECIEPAWLDPSTCECIINVDSGETTEGTTVSTCPNVGEPCYPNAFGYGTIDNNCECNDVIWCYPYCPEGERIDWDHCYSCSNCACLPEVKICPDEPCNNADPFFCDSRRNPDTCECETVCCAQPYCPNGFEVCDSCSNCRCKECPTEECPDYGPFCDTWRNPDTCQCETVCCDQPYCPNGFEVCDSCSNCRCKECPAEPCPDQGPFCNSTRNPETCNCDMVCCDQPKCEGSGVDWDKCTSCSQCPCLPKTTTTTKKPTKPTKKPTTTTQKPCKKTCEKRKGCTAELNMKTCECDYHCSHSKSSSSCSK